MLARYLLHLGFSALVVFVTSEVSAQTPPAAPTEFASLPAPSGKFSVGRTTIRVPRPEGAAPQQRELVIHIWYPAEPGGKGSPYVPDWEKAQQALSEQQKRQGLKAVFEGMQTGSLKSHATQDATILVGEERWPLLLFSHGLGISSVLYSAQLEDLASHGYVVAGVEHASSSTFVVFSDGRVVGYDREKWRNAGTGSEERIAVEKTNLESLAADLLLALDALSGKLPSSVPEPLRNRIDAQKVGVFGHSYGARAAVRACQLDSRFGACINQDGLSQGHPYHQDADGKRLVQPFLFLLRKSPYLPKLIATDEQLAKAGTTREASQRQSEETQTKITDSLRAVEGGGLWLSLDVPSISHLSYTDVPLLSAAATERRDPQRALEVIREVTRRFFDDRLKSFGAGDGFNELRNYPEVVKVFEYNPAAPR